MAAGRCRRSPPSPAPPTRTNARSASPPPTPTGTSTRPIWRTATVCRAPPTGAAPSWSAASRARRQAAGSPGAGTAARAGRPAGRARAGDHPRLREVVRHRLDPGQRHGGRPAEACPTDGRDHSGRPRHAAVPRPCQTGHPPAGGLRGDRSGSLSQSGDGRRRRPRLPAPWPGGRPSAFRRSRAAGSTAAGGPIPAPGRSR